MFAILRKSFFPYVVGSLCNVGESWDRSMRLQSWQPLLDLVGEVREIVLGHGGDCVWRGSCFVQLRGKMDMRQKCVVRWSEGNNRQL